MLAARWVPYAFLLPALLGLGVFRLVPIGIALTGGFFGTTLMGETLFVGLRNYTELLSDPTIWNSIRVTLIFNLLINPFQVAAAFALAMLVFRPTPGVTLFRAAYFMPMCVSIAVAGVIWMVMLDPTLGPVNGVIAALGFERMPFFRDQATALLSLIGIASWKGVGYWMLFLLAGLVAIPRGLYEAAELDGATGWQRFRHLTLPLMRRPLTFVLVADTAINFLFFAPVYVITQGGPDGATDLLMFQAYKSAFVYLNTGRSLAISTIILLIIAVFAAVEFRLFRVRGEA